MPIEVEVSHGNRALGPVGCGDRARRRAPQPRSFWQSGHAMEFLKDQYRHCKTILLIGAAAALLDRRWHSAHAALGRR